MRIVLGGMVASVPGHGGATWAALQYAIGLEELGHEVLIVDESRDPEGLDRQVRYLTEVESEFGLDGSVSLLVPGQGATGVPLPKAQAFAESADLLINLAATVRDPRILESVPHRLYVDLDPAFTQLWHAVEGVDMAIESHDRFASVGLRLHSPDCEIPDCGVRWEPTLPPVVLSRWPRVSVSPVEGLTCIANWRSYGAIEHDGVRFGQKAHSVRELIDLPRQAGEQVRFALLIDPHEVADLDALRSNDWHLIDAAEVTATPAAYAGFVQRSTSELGIAKEGYVVSRCGWFSDRSACYLASGRPVLAQRTGWEHVLPEGDGLLAFSSAEEAADRLAELRADFRHHAGAARSLAEEHLDSSRVLPKLLAGALDG